MPTGVVALPTHHHDHHDRHAHVACQDQGEPKRSTHVHPNRPQGHEDERSTDQHVLEMVLEVVSNLVHQRVPFIVVWLSISSSARIAL